MQKQKASQDPSPGQRQKRAFIINSDREVALELYGTPRICIYVYRAVFYCENEYAFIVTTGMLSMFRFMILWYK